MVLEFESRVGLQMNNGDHSRQIFCFGAFEADLETGELCKNGAKVPLQSQPFQVFAILLKRSGELVSRDELRQNVWPQDTFVDFDQAVNTAIKKIRIALGDEADNPRFVQTLPGRGYRFICPVLTGNRQVAEAEYPAEVVASRLRCFGCEPRGCSLVPAPPAASTADIGLFPNHPRWPPERPDRNRRQQALSPFLVFGSANHFAGWNSRRRDCPVSSTVAESSAL
jgi:DNA-binding winged helix-turn-helix (wHTH) protein